MVKFFEIGKKFVKVVLDVDDVVEVSYFGKAPTLAEVKTLFKKTNLYARGIELNRKRTAPFRLHSRVGTSGAIDWFVKYVQEIGEIGGARSKIIKTKYIMHVSMNEKLNKGVSAWLGDVVLVLARYPADDDVEIREISELEYPTERSFHNPSKFDWNEYFSDSE